MKKTDKVEALAKAKSFVLFEYYKRNPLQWLKNCVFTIDEHAEGVKVKHFPMRPYVAPLVELFFDEPILLIPKSRQMTATWLCISLCTHELIFNEYFKTFVMSKKEDDAVDLINRMRFIYTHLPMYMQNLSPLKIKLKDQPMNQLVFKNGSSAKGLPQGEDQVRQYTVSRLFCDEAAIQDKFEGIYGNAQPSLMGGGKLVAISSVNPGFFQRLCEKE